MASFTDLIAGAKQLLAGMLTRGAILLVRSNGAAESTDSLTSLQAGPNGGLMTEPAPGSDVATETTLAARAGTVRHTTTPSKVDAETGPIETDKSGNTFVNASPGWFRRLNVPTTTPNTVAQAAFSVGQINGLRIDSAVNMVAWGQPAERPWMAIDGTFTGTPAGTWTGANWTIAGNKATHTAGATTALTQDTSATNPTDPIVETWTYLVLFTVSGRTAGSVTLQLGTTADGAGARSTNAPFYAFIAAQAPTINFVPSSDFDGAISDVTVVPVSPQFAGYMWEPMRFSHVFGVALASAPTALIATSPTFAWRYRYPGATELG